MRGEYAYLAPSGSSWEGSPPLARGVLCHCSSEFFIGRITPACAGSTRNISIKTLITKDHPRLRGEYSLPSTKFSFKMGSPPLARGVHMTVIEKSSIYRITPACAGSTNRNHREKSVIQDHPHLRGEYLNTFEITVLIPGSPPLARGVQNKSTHNLHRQRITPACAGSTQLLSASQFPGRDHPRLRGEYLSCLSRLDLY